MRYNQIITGYFRERMNRFTARVLVDGAEQIVHVKNTGRLKELLIPGVEVVLEISDNPDRKTKYSLIAVYKDKQLVNIDSQAPNQVAFEALKAGAIQEIYTGLPNTSLLQAKKEVTFGKSRFDLYFESEREKGFIEVKGVTLDRNGTAAFPDAPTERGTKHVLEMIEAVKGGYAGYILFLIQMKGIQRFTPNWEMDPDFAIALTKASYQSVKILAYDSIVTENELRIGQPIPVKLS